MAIYGPVGHSKNICDAYLRSVEFFWVTYLLIYCHLTRSIMNYLWFLILYTYIYIYIYIYIFKLCLYHNQIWETTLIISLDPGFFGEGVNYRSKCQIKPGKEIIGGRICEKSWFHAKKLYFPVLVGGGLCQACWSWICAWNSCNLFTAVKTKTQCVTFFFSFLANGHSFHFMWPKSNSISQLGLSTFCIRL